MHVYVIDLFFKKSSSLCSLVVSFKFKPLLFFPEPNP